jgi:hypothetical protein
MFSFWCTNIHHKRDRGQFKECIFCGDDNEDWRHILNFQGIGALIFRTVSWDELRKKMNKLEIHPDIWHCIDHGLQHFSRHPLSTDRSRPTPPFGSSLRENNVLLNNAAATKSHIGWPNLLKGRISNEWAKLWTKSMGLQTFKSRERALIQALWDHTYRLWIFRNNEDHKNDNRAIAQYKQQALDIRITQQY